MHSARREYWPIGPKRLVWALPGAEPHPMVAAQAPDLDSGGELADIVTLSVTMHSARREYWPIGPKRLVGALSGAAPHPMVAAQAPDLDSGGELADIVILSVTMHSAGREYWPIGPKRLVGALSGAAPHPMVAAQAPDPDSGLNSRTW